MNNSLFQSDGFTVGGVGALFIILSTVSMVTLLILVFPCYVLVNRANREKDKQLSVYPILKHFYQSICIFYCIIGIGVIYIIYFAILNRKSEEVRFYHGLLTIPIVMIGLIMAIFVETHNFIIALLSLQRFLLVFSRNIEKYIKPTEQESNKYLIGIYVAFYMGHFVYFGWCTYQDNQGGVTDSTIRIYLIFYIILNSILLLSGFLYIPIMLKIRKLASLSSTIQNRHQQFILYQTCSTVAFKLSHSYIIWYVEFDALPVSSYLFFLLFFDLISTPVLIQTSYLLCSKENFDILQKKLNIEKLKSFSLSARTSRVEPIELQNQTV
ncbi:hypothetical protein CRE_02518 [Caenorhabditis remanei]|uniref:Uncharacterized protein n=1 Tax=Caenorhabditis remanei TaxID=31234 RepID=E3MWP4_CAERE|nr:hypothetical protein CRE_02518 [Caenorhabditis remanei]